MFEFEAGLHVLNLIIGASCIYLANNIYRYFSKTSLGPSMQIIGAGFGWFLFFETLNILKSAGVAEQIGNAIPNFELLIPLSELLFVLVLLYGIFRLRDAFEKFHWLQEIDRL